MSGGGDNFFEEVGNTFINATTQAFTAGMVGYKDGQFGQGVVSRGIDEGIGELTGRNMQRDVLDQQRTALAKAQADEEEERANNISRARDQDILASRASAIAKRRGSLGLGGDSASADVLGV